MTALIHCEFAKVRTLRWWRQAVAALAALTVLAAAWNAWQSSMFLRPFPQYLESAVTVPVSSLGPEQIDSLHGVWVRQSDIATVAATLYTSGQFVALLVVALVGASLIATEFTHHTLAATFLCAPRRPSVILAKLVCVVAISAALWAVTLVSAVIAVPFLLSHSAPAIPSGSVASAVALNLLAYILWGLLGFGVGVLVRQQTAAAIVITVAYLATTILVSFAFQAVHEFLIQDDLVLALQVLVPGAASQILTSPAPVFAQSPPPWVAAAVLFGYAGAAAAWGCARLQRQDL